MERQSYVPLVRMTAVRERELPYGILYIRKEGSNNRSSHKIVLNGKLVNKRFLWLKRNMVEAIWEKLEEE